jgi:hypothetical protein
MSVAIWAGKGTAVGPEELEADLMCVWDGTYTAPEDEREAMDQIPGWNDDAASMHEHRHAKARESLRERRRTRWYLKAA